MKNNIWANFFCLVLFLCSFAPATLLQAQWSDNAADNNKIITLNSSAQQKPVIASDGQNGAIILWEDNRNNNVDIYAQRLHESGNRSWTQNGVEIVVSDNLQNAPAIAVTGTGTGVFYVSWLDEDNDFSESEVILQAFRYVDGRSTWDTPSVTHQGRNAPPRVLLSSIGKIITAAYIPFGIDDRIGVQVIDVDGKIRFGPPQIFVNNQARGRQSFRPPSVVPALDGGILAAWKDTRLDTAVYVTGVDQNGVSWVAGEQRLKGSIIANKNNPVITPDGGGGAIIAWIQKKTATDSVRVTRINNIGSIVWKSDLTTTTGKKQNLLITADNSNGAFLVWENVSGINVKLYAQHITNDGTDWSNDRPLSTGTGNQLNASVATGSAGNLLCTWEDDRNGTVDIFAQAIDLTDTLVWDSRGDGGGVGVSTARNTQTLPAITSDGLGGAIITWQDKRNGNFDIYAQRVSVNGALGEFRTVGINNPTNTSEWEIGSAQTIQWQASPQIEKIKIELSRNGGGQFEELFDALTATNNSVNISAVSGPPSEQCVLRISAVSLPHINSTSDIFKITKKTGPSLKPDGVNSADVGQEMTVTSTTTDPSGIKKVELFYKQGGASIFLPSNMVQTDSSNYSGTIPSGSVTARGLQYFIKATDNVNAVSFSKDTIDVTVRFTAGTLKKQVKAGSRQNSYVMISSPNKLSQPLADSVFIFSGFGAYDTTSWRLFDYRDSVYVEFDSVNAGTFNFLPGNAYWLISANTRNIDFGGGVSLPTRADYPVTLTPGWNQIANPFNFAVAWNGIGTNPASANISRPWFYNGSYDTTTTIVPFRGYFVKNSEKQNVTLKIPADEFVNPSPSLAKNKNGLQWEIQLKAYCQEARDEYNLIGIHDDAAQVWDRFDQPEPPPIGAFVSLYFPRWHWQHYPDKYATDYRNRLNRGQTWEFEVRNNIINSEVRVEFFIESLPENLQITLLDPGLKVSRDLRENTVYRFPTGSSATTKTLKLLVGNSDYVSEKLAAAGLTPTRFELAQNFPNPFNPTTSIRYGLPGESKVTLRIYDILGREIVKLVDSKDRKAGYHVINWNGRDNAGIPVASGVYIYHITAGKFAQARKMLLVK